MGQCQCCRGGQDGGHKAQGPLNDNHKYYDSDSALDSSQSANEDANGNPKQVPSVHSSQSSGKYSLRESVVSCGDCAQAEYPLATTQDSDPGTPFSDDNEESMEDEGDVQGRDALTPLRDIKRGRKTSRGSPDSERRSVSPAAPATTGLKAALGRSLSLKLQRTMPSAEVLNSCSWVEVPEPKQHQRSVSLRLPRTRTRPRSFTTRLPTIYVDDAEQPDRRGQDQDMTKKISLNHALSLLNVNTLARQEAQKPVQKILRQPRRRHNTVRGMSGMAIEAANQVGRHRYYPTSTSLRYPRRPTSEDC